MNELIQKIKELPVDGEAQSIAISEIVHDLENEKPMVDIMFTVGLMWDNSKSYKSSIFLEKLLTLLLNHKN
jgi:hypothetical protein